MFQNGIYRASKTMPHLQL